MTKLIEDLLELQTILKLGDNATVEQRTKVEELRTRIPAPILGHFLRQLGNGRRGIALVRGGVCGECHIRLAHSFVYMLGRSNDLLVCENCGAFVALAPEEKPALLADTPLAAKSRRARKPRAVAV